MMVLADNIEDRNGVVGTGYFFIFFWREKLEVSMFIRSDISCHLYSAQCEERYNRFRKIVNIIRSYLNVKLRGSNRRGNSKSNLICIKTHLPSQNSNFNV